MLDDTSILGNAILSGFGKSLNSMYSSYPLHNVWY
jgi:hypothetical protein